MPRTYSSHAERRMRRRKITEEEVDAALRRRTGPPRPGDNGNLVVFGYGRGSRILKIVMTPDEQVIVSVMAVGED
jgi:Domain of unknown function (DUF4258)